jgi:DNA-binding NarL/FixJ family response regulator
VLEASLLLAARTDDPRGRELAADIAARSRAFATSEREAYLGALQLEFQISLYDADAERALVLADEIADAARGFDETTRVRALVRGGGAARLFGAFAAAEVRLRPAWAEARTLMLPPLIVQAAYELAGCLFRLARLDEAEAVVEEAQELALRLGDPTQERFGTQRVAALIALERGDWRSGVDDVERAIADEPDRHLHIDLREAAATALARVAPTREHNRIRVHLTRARADAEAVGCRRCSGELMLVSAELLARIDSLDDARAALAEADRRGVAEDLGRTGSFWRSRAEALISLHAGDAADAAAQLERVVEEAQRLERNLDVLWLQLDQAQALAAVNRGRALELLEAVASHADAYGARTASGVADALRRRLGVRTWRRSRADGTALSEREQEIATLVAGGASNPEIAQALFLSRKTVERHVSNILAKVGARNRVELATLLPREGEGAHR